MTDENTYPRLVRGRWVGSPLEHLALYAARAREQSESHVAVPASLLLLASKFRECSDRRTFCHDEDGPLPPCEVVCRRQAGHDAAGNPRHVQEHSNGYYTWRGVTVETLLEPREEWRG